MLRRLRPWLHCWRYSRLDLAGCGSRLLSNCWWHHRGGRVDGPLRGCGCGRGGRLGHLGRLTGNIGGRTHSVVGETLEGAEPERHIVVVLFLSRIYGSTGRQTFWDVFDNEEVVDEVRIIVTTTITTTTVVVVIVVLQQCGDATVVGFFSPPAVGEDHGMAGL